MWVVLSGIRARHSSGSDRVSIPTVDGKRHFRAVPGLGVCKVRLHFESDYRWVLCIHERILCAWLRWTPISARTWDLPPVVILLFRQSTPLLHARGVSYVVGNIGAVSAQ